MHPPAAGRLRRTAPPAGRWLAAALVLGAALTGLSVPRAPAQQLNFRPLERGDYVELEQRIKVARALEVGADYAFRVRTQNQKDLPPDQRNTDISQDFRLNLKTVFHTDIELHLTLELVEQGFTEGTSRAASGSQTGNTNDGFPTALNAREAYLRYSFNPRSRILVGKQELSLGDRRGKVFDALVPAITFDCQVATWCMPAGVANLGHENASSVAHWALQYNAWDDETATGRRDRLQVEVFRVLYQESDVPLGRNLGPARYNTADPTDPTRADPSQLIDSGAAPGGQPIYYDARDQNYYGFRLLWEGGPFFANLDAIGFKGERRYHLYGESPNLSAVGLTEYFKRVRGSAVETELGYRWDQGRLGLRYLSATGDSYQTNVDGLTYNRALSGYYEIIPGSYRGTRLWFNGGGSSVEDGAGLGHSINNTRLLGFFLDWADPTKRALAYSLGAYDLRYNKPIRSVDGKLEDRIGFELDNVLTFFLHKALKLQMEANGILSGPAFRIDDYTQPSTDPAYMYQFVGRVVYAF